MKIIFILLSSFLLLSLPLLVEISIYAQPIFNNININNINGINKINNTNETNKKFLDIRLSSNIQSASMRYDNNAVEILEDTLLYNYIDTTADSTIQYRFPYTTDLTRQKYNLHIGYIGLENFYVYAALSLMHTNVIEKFSYDSNMTSRLVRNEKSETTLEGLYLDAGYTFKFDKLNTNLTLVGGLFVPAPRADKLLVVDSTDEPINNKYLNYYKSSEINIGTIFDINLKPIHFQIGGVYNNREGKFTDRILTNFLIGLNSVENTELSANFKYNTSLTDYKNEDKISFWKYPTWSKTLDVELEFKMCFTEELYINIGYNICLWAKNTLALRIVNINIGYLF